MSSVYSSMEAFRKTPAKYVEAQVNILGAGCDWKLELESLIHYRFLLPLKNIFLGLAGSMSGVELYTSDS